MKLNEILAFASATENKLGYVTIDSSSVIVGQRDPYGLTPLTTILGVKFLVFVPKEDPETLLVVSLDTGTQTKFSNVSEAVGYLRIQYLNADSV